MPNGPTVQSGEAAGPGLPVSDPLAGPSTSSRDPSLLAASAVADTLGTDIGTGLSAGEAARRLARRGPNALNVASPVPKWRRLLAQFHDPLIYLLLAAILVALIAWQIEGGAGWPVDAIVITLVVLFNAALGYVQEARAENAVAALARMTAVTSSVLRDGRPQRIPSAELVPGDLLMLAEGDAVGADARLLRAAALRVQEASLTGESEAVLKDPQTLPAPAPPGDRLCMVFKGTAVAQGTGCAVVTATGMDTEMGAIAGMLEATREAPTPLQKEVVHIGRMLGIAVVIIALDLPSAVLRPPQIGIARRTCRGRSDAGQRPHRRLHGAGVRAAVQLLQRPLGDRQRLPPPVRQPLAVVGGRGFGAASGRGGACRPAQRRLRHGGADARPVAGLCRDGERRAVVRGGAQASPAGSFSRRLAYVRNRSCISAI